MMPLSRNTLGWLAVFTALLVTGCRSSAQGTGQAELRAAEPWAVAAEILQRIVPPQFPRREFDLAKFGAVADGKTDCTKAFARAIADCAQAGGGKVVVPAGKYYTGPIHLHSGVNLHLADGAEIIFSDQLEDYLHVVMVRDGGVEL